MPKQKKLYIHLFSHVLYSFTILQNSLQFSLTIVFLVIVPHATDISTCASFTVCCYQASKSSIW